MEKTLTLVVLIVAFVVSMTKQERCHDYLGKNQCSFLKRYGTCYTHEKRMRLFCRKTCQFCTGRDLCENYFCKWNKKCDIENGIPVCKCHKGFCKDAKKTGEVCTISGQTFANLCDLIYEECVTGKTMHVRHYGNCDRTEKCADAPRESKFGLCESWKKSGLCESVTGVMKRYCARTCNLCIQHIQPLCESSEYGCCWWHKTIAASGPNQEGCRACTDLKFCKHFQAECGQGTNTEFMKKNCPNSCHYCSASVDEAKVAT